MIFSDSLKQKREDIQRTYYNLERATSVYSCHGVFTDQVVFLERFWREFRISFESHKPVSKTYRPKNNNFCLLMTLRFPF